MNEQTPGELPAPDGGAPRQTLEVDRIALRRLDPGIVLLWRIGWLIRTVFVSAAAAAALNWFDVGMSRPLVVGALFGLGLIGTVWWPAVQYRHWGFQVRGTDVFIAHGVLWRTTSVVPHARIQHVDTQQGPLERWAGLASVIMFTAGTVGAAIAIPGLARADAEALRERLAALSGSDDAV